MSPCTSRSDRRIRAGLAAAALLTLAPGLAAAQTGEAEPATPAACAGQAPPLPAPLAAWAAKRDLTSATSIADLAPASIAVGNAVQVALHGTREVSYPLQPAKPGGSVAHGGLLQVAVSTAGTYRVALSSGAWIDMVRDGQAVDSTFHGHGPACSTIRKMVDFPLTPGVYVLQISANPAADIGVLVTKAP